MIVCDFISTPVCYYLTSVVTFVLTVLSDTFVLLAVQCTAETLMLRLCVIMPLVLYREDEAVMLSIPQTRRGV